MRVSRLVAFVGAVLVLGGCNVAARVQITMRDDGTGTVAASVTLDPDAVARLGGAAALPVAVPLTDARAAGWTVSPWRRGPGGVETITFGRPFASARELTRAIADLSGPSGILGHPGLVHARGWFSRQDALSVVVDVRSPNVDLVHDATLAAHLRAAHLDPGRLQAELAAQVQTALHVSVVLEVPGHNAKTFDVVNGQVQTVRLSNESTNWDRVVKVGIAVAVGLLGLAFFLAAAVGARRNRRRDGQRGRAAAPEADRAPLM